MTKKTQIKPLFDNVLIEPLEAEEVTAAGIVLPDSAKEKPQKGRIIATGPGSVDDKGKKVPMTVSVGQTVMYKKWGGNEIKADGKELMLVEQKDILAIVK